MHGRPRSLSTDSPTRTTGGQTRSQRNGAVSVKVISLHAAAAWRTAGPGPGGPREHCGFRGQRDWDGVRGRARTASATASPRPPSSAPPRLHAQSSIRVPGHIPSDSDSRDLGSPTWTRSHNAPRAAPAPRRARPWPSKGPELGRRCRPPTPLTARDPSRTPRPLRPMRELPRAAPSRAPALTSREAPSRNLRSAQASIPTGRLPGSKLGTSRRSLAAGGCADGVDAVTVVGATRTARSLLLDRRDGGRSTAD